MGAGSQTLCGLCRKAASAWQSFLFNEVEQELKVCVSA